MFYSVHILGPAEDGAPLRMCWLASHGRKPGKHDLAEFSIPDAAKLIQKPEVALSLRYYVIIVVPVFFAMASRWLGRIVGCASRIEKYSNGSS